VARGELVLSEAERSELSSLAAWWNTALAMLLRFHVL